MSLVKVKNTFSDWLCLDDDNFIDVVLATVIAHRFGGDPLWLFLVAPSGSGKTELLRSLQSDSVYHLSALTPHAFVSGLNQSNKKDPSLLPHIKEKVVVIKDFTTVLSENQKVCTMIFGQLRDIYDGSTSKAFGSGVGTRAYDCHISLIAGVTPAIEKYQILGQVLGERFLNYRIHVENRDKIVDQARWNDRIWNIRYTLSIAYKRGWDYHPHQ